VLSDPIVALATPPGRSALAIVRLSGQGAFAVAARVIAGFQAEPPRVARYAPFREAAGLIDRGIYVAFRGPASYTGEDLVELTCHGGAVVPARLVAALLAAGARLAAPGEFTRRAVLNGKLDLLQAEAVGDLSDAEVPAQAQAALRQLEGGLSRRISGLRDQLLELLALLAYEVDFPDEDDGPVSRTRLEAARAAALASVERMLATAPLAERVRRGGLVVITGAPNVGKSSLFNALLGSARTLVTEIPGTTRDAVEAQVDFFGWPIRLVDTAGLGEAVDQLDALGQGMSRRYAAAADLVLACDDGRQAERRLEPTWRAVLRVRTKADLGPEGGDGLRVSAVTGAGLDALKLGVVERLFAEGASFADLEPALTRERHRLALEESRTALTAAAPHLATGGEAVLAAHHVQAAVRSLDLLIGAVDVDQVLERVFSTFCVGK
jgi:tRNA modification GTPase